jgi:DNA polymerase-3 subunit epsilon
MEKLADQFFLCHKLLGLEGDKNGRQACFRSQLKKCLGACHGAESATNYNKRMSVALKNYQIKLWPYAGPILLEERDPQSQDQVAFHIVDRWRYIAKLSIIEDIYDLGYQLLDPNNRPPSLVDEVIDIPDSTDNHFDLDIYFILVRFLVNPKKIEMNCLKIWPLVELSSVN